MSSAVEFDGTGDPELYPFKSKQQIAAKLLDLFGDSDLKVMMFYPICANITLSSSFVRFYFRVSTVFDRLTSFIFSHKAGPLQRYDT